MIHSTTYLQRDSHTKDDDVYQWNYCCFWRSGSFIVTTIRVLWLQIKKVNSRTDSCLLIDRQTFSYALKTALLLSLFNNKVKIISKMNSLWNKECCIYGILIIFTSSYFREPENVFRLKNSYSWLFGIWGKLNKLQPLQWNI